MGHLPSLFLRALILVVAFLFAVLLFGASREIFPPSFIAGGIRGILLFGFMCFIWHITKNIGSVERDDGLAKKKMNKTPSIAKSTSIPAKTPLIKEVRPTKTFLANSQNNSSSPEGGHEVSKENDEFPFKAELERRIYAYLLKEEKDEATMLQARVMCDGDTKKAETTYYKLRYQQIVESDEIEKFRKAILAEKPQQILLRSQPCQVSENDLKNMIIKYNFFHRTLNSQGLFKNVFVDNGNNTVTDKATGLMWQKGGLSHKVSFYEAKLYIDSINRKQHLGYSDWRIPTIEEHASLLKLPTKTGIQLFKEQVFEKEQTVCWSSDSKDKIYVWFVRFTTGSIFWSFDDLNYYIKAVRSIT